MLWRKITHSRGKINPTAFFLSLVLNPFIFYFLVLRVAVHVCNGGIWEAKAKESLQVIVGLGYRVSESPPPPSKTQNREFTGLSLIAL